MSKSPSYIEQVIRYASTLCNDDKAEPSSVGEALRIRGLLAGQSGHLDAALACLTRSLAILPDAECSIDLGDTLCRVGRPRRALAAYLLAMKLEPRDWRTYLRLSRLLRRHGRADVAAALCRIGIELANDAHFHIELGNALRTLRRLSDAIRHYEHGLHLDPAILAGYEQLGRAQLEAGEIPNALATFRQGLAYASDHTGLHFGVSEALYECGLFDQALESMQRLLLHVPNHLGASRLLCRVYEVLGQSVEQGNALCHTGALLLLARRYHAAATTFQQARVLQPDSPIALAGEAHATLACGRPAECLQLARVAGASLPNNSEIRSDLASAFHLTGQFDRGWNEFADLYNAHELRRRGFVGPVWDGGSLHGQTLLLWTDMGRGDVIHSLRYLPLAAAQEGHIFVKCNHQGLTSLVERMQMAERVLSWNAPVPHYDCHAPLNFFPALVKRYRNTPVNEVPYLSADPELVQLWRMRLGSSRDLSVGLSWGGNVETRSAPGRFVPLAMFGLLRDVPGVRFFSLQHGAQLLELLTLPEGLTIERSIDEASSIDDAAALIVSLDLVISVDTMIAHLAGALGKPVWTLLRYATNWRWGTEGQNTFWYPTMRLFRQTSSGNWTGAFEQVYAELSGLAREHSTQLHSSKGV